MKIIKTLRDTILPRFKPQEHEQLIIDIIGLLFQDDDTECITAPISGKYYISNKLLFCSLILRPRVIVSFPRKASEISSKAS